MYAPDHSLDAVEALYDRGLFLQAHELARHHGFPGEWKGTRARILASRLVGQLGNRPRAHALATLAWREDSADLGARTHYGRGLIASRGPLAAWEFLGADPHVPEDAPPDERAAWACVHGYTLALLRDFDRAADWLDRVSATPPYPWLWVERSVVLALQDRSQEALDSARRALELQPNHPSAILNAAHLLRRLERQDEAVALVQEASDRIESFWVTAYLLQFFLERQAFEQAFSQLDRLTTLGPMLPPESVRWLTGVRSDIAYYRGDYPAAIDFARQAGPGFHRTIAEHMAAFTGVARRVHLGVPFVQQHFRTCGPATLTSLGRYWGDPLDHAELARQISYEGTWDHVERHWAESNGYVVREFAVTWDAAVAILDRGIPFSLTTVRSTSAHLQAVIGYDTLRGVLLVQDPTNGLVEYVAATLLDGQRATGPRGMALVPATEAHRLAECELPDADLYDALYRLRRALAVHERDAAARECHSLASAHPAHPLAIRARWDLVAYDMDLLAALGCVEALLAAFPGDEFLEMRKFGYLTTLARRQERLDLVDAICHRDGRDPVWWQVAAEEHRSDSREWEKAERLDRRVLRRLPEESGPYFTLGMIRMGQRRFDEGVDLLRFAACLAPTDEFLNDAYFTATHRIGRVEEALRFLRARVARYSAQSSQPVRTLFGALARCHRLSEGFAALDETMAIRPDDAELLLFAAREHARDGHDEQATALLTRARAGARSADWTRAAAEIALARGDNRAALDRWREVAALELFAVDVHRQVVVLLEQQMGLRAAIEHLREIAARAPHHLEIQQLHLEWLRGADSPEVESVLRRLLDAHPIFSWAHRELALYLMRQGRLDEAAAVSNTVLELEPTFSYNHSIRGMIHSAAGERSLACERLREAVRLDVDNGVAVTELVGVAEDHPQRVDALSFVRRELERQTVFGLGLSSYRHAARSVLRPDDVLGLCREALAARPDLLPAWTETIRQLIEVGNAGEARNLAGQAIERFPLMAEAHSLEAEALLLAGDRMGQIEALRRARDLAPGEPGFPRALGEALRETGEIEAARAELLEALGRYPRDVSLHGTLAETLWALGDREGALRHVERAVQLAPDYNWGWDQLRRWSRDCGDPDRPLRVARVLTTDFAGVPNAWLALALQCGERDLVEEQLAALEQAIALNPRLIDAHDLRALALAGAGRFDEATAACSPSAFAVAPLALRGRATWIEALRGNRRLAIDQMKRLLDEQPNYAWGWLALANWHYEEGETARAAEAATWLTRLEPRSANAWAQQGRMRVAAGQRAEGKAALQQAITLEPAHEWAGLMLFDAQLEDHELNSAAQTLEDLDGRIETPQSLARRVQLAIARGAKRGALSAFEQLCAASPDDAYLVRSAGEAFVRKGWSGQLDAVLAREAAENPAVGAGVAIYWATRAAEAFSWYRRIEPLAALFARGEMGARAAVAFLETAGNRRRAALAQRVHRSSGDLFRQRVDIWGSYGYVLQSSDRPAQAVDWLSDWRARPEARPWMLYNLVEALRRLGRWAEAAEVSLYAMSLAADQTTPYHQAWLAIDDALAGDLAAARARVEHVRGESVSVYCRVLLDLVWACLETGDADGHPNPEGLGRAWVLFRQVRRQCNLRKSAPELRQAHDLCRAQLLELEGGLRARIASWYFRRVGTRWLNRLLIVG